MLITLQNQTMSAGIESIGAELLSLKDSQGKEYMWQRDPKFWPRCSPLLFPAIGNSRNDKTMFEGEWYPLPKHGFCRDIDFNIIKQGKDFVTLQTHQSEYTKTMYPYDFSLSLTYTLTSDGIRVDYQVENIDSRTIYYCLGAHPGFFCPIEEGETFEDYQLEFEQKETQTAMVYDSSKMQFNRNHRIPVLNDSNVVPLDYHLFDYDALYFDQIRSKKVSLIHSQTRKGVEVSYPGFSSVAFWTPTGLNAPFLCVEPWNGSAICSDEDDFFSSKHDVQVLNTRMSKKHHLSIRIL